MKGLGCDTIHIEIKIETHHWLASTLVIADDLENIGTNTEVKHLSI